MRFYLIDALRGIAALWVVFFHAFEGGHINDFVEILPDIFEYMFFKNSAGVPIFFVLSGFVIAHSMTSDNINGSYVAKFIVRRSIRLDPPYWASIILVVIMAWLASRVKSEPMIWPDINSIIAHLFYMQSLLEIDHINRVYWTLCLEIQFYIVFCLILYINRMFEKNYKYSFMVIFLIIAIVSLLWPTKILTENLMIGLFLPHWHAFLLGVFGYWSWKKKILAYYFYIYAIILLCTSIYTESGFTLAATLTAILLHEVAIRDYISVGNWKYIQFLGKISYSLYLTHNPITGASYYVIYSIFGKSLVVESIAFIISTFACIFFAYVFWWLFEKWSIKLSKRVLLHKEYKK